MYKKRVVLSFVAFIFAFICVQYVSASQSEMDEILARWRFRVVASDDYRNYSEIISKNNGIRNRALGDWLTMNKSATRKSLWGSVDLTQNTEEAAAEFYGQYNELRYMAMAYCTASAPTNSAEPVLKGNKDLLKDIINGLDWMRDYAYIKRDKVSTLSWHHLEISAPQYLIETLILIRDHLTQAQLKSYLDVSFWYMEDPAYAYDKTSAQSRKAGTELTGANRSDACLVVLGRGLLLKDEAQIKLSMERMIDETGKIFEYSTSGDGFYEDGSFIQHKQVPYNWGYGEVLFKNIARLFFLTSGTSYFDTYITKEDISYIHNVIDKAFIKTTYKGLGFDMVRGRIASRYTVPDYRMGELLVELLYLMSKHSEEPYKTKYENVIKYTYKQLGTILSSSLAHITDQTVVVDVKENIIKNDKVTGDYSPVGHFGFRNMDRVVHARENFAFVISMYSPTILAYEGNTNKENLQGWHTSDGMTYLYLDDKKQYSGNYWATINRKRLPGITVDTKELEEKTGQFRNFRDFVGGTSLDNYGIAAMHLDKRNASGEVDTTGIVNPNLLYETPALNMDLEAKKSWFMFDNEIVALGTGISSTLDTGVETIIENRKLSDKEKAFIIEGNEIVGNEIVRNNVK